MHSCAAMAIVASLCACACDPEASDELDEIRAMDDVDDVDDMDDMDDVHHISLMDDAKNTPVSPTTVDALTGGVHGTNYVVQGTSYTWLQGQPEVWMGSTSDVVCWLIEVGGDFEGHHEMVEIRQRNGGWVLGGKSYQSGLKATAHCIPRTYWGQTLNYTLFDGTFYNAEYAHKDLGPADGRVCFLTGMLDKFEGSGEFLNIYTDGGRWWMWGGSQAGETVYGKAICMNTGWRIGPFNWSQGAAAVAMASAVDWVCGLTRVTGKFEGAGERVRTPVLGDGWWYLTGTSQQTGLGASAYCI